jgi:hypothetical protein
MIDRLESPLLSWSHRKPRVERSSHELRGGVSTISVRRLDKGTWKVGGEIAASRVSEQCRISLFSDLVRPHARGKLFKVSEWFFNEFSKTSKEFTLRIYNTFFR